MSGIVVDHKEAGVRYAISERNFNEKVHVKVRDLKPGETVLGFRPKPLGALLSEGEETVEYYKGREWTVDALQLELDTRNQELEDDEKIVPDSGKKADLIAALLLDDEALAESEAGHSNQE